MLLSKGGVLSNWMWVSISHEFARGRHGVYTLNMLVGWLPVGYKCFWFQELIMGGEFGVKGLGSHFEAFTHAKQGVEQYCNANLHQIC